SRSYQLVQIARSRPARSSSQNRLQIACLTEKMSQPLMPTPRPPERTRIPGSLLIVLLLLAISVFINYIDRGNLSIAAPMLKDELGISAAQLGVLLSAFFWTYATLHLFYGWLVDRLNVNWIFAGAFFLWSAATAATGLVHSFAALFVLRLLLGMGESASYPSYNKILALNFSEEHRGRANSVLASGLLLGPGFGMLFGGLLMARFGWRPFFIVLGLMSLLWILPWLKWMPKKQYAVQTDSTGAPNLLEFLQFRSAWGTCIGLFCGNYVNYFLITWLPFFPRRGCFVVFRLALGSLDRRRSVADIGLQNVYRRRHGHGWNFSRARAHRRALPLCRGDHRGRYLLCRLRLQCLDHHPDARRTARSRTLGRISKLLRQYVRLGGPSADGIGPSAHRPLPLGVCHHGWICIGKRRIHYLPRRARRTGRLEAQTPPRRNHRLIWVCRMRESCNMVAALSATRKVRFSSIRVHGRPAPRRFPISPTREPGFQGVSVTQNIKIAALLLLALNLTACSKSSQPRKAGDCQPAAPTETHNSVPRRKLRQVARRRPTGVVSRPRCAT